jgi:hypothetical protein
MDSMETNEKKDKIVYLPTSTLLSLLVMMASWMISLLLWAGRSITNEQWPGNLKLIVCNSLCVITTLFYLIYGRRDLRKMRDLQGSRIGVSGGQALWVVILVVATGVYGTWLVWGPPFVPPWNGR